MHDIHQMVISTLLSEKAYVVLDYDSLGVVAKITTSLCIESVYSLMMQPKKEG